MAPNILIGALVVETPETRVLEVVETPGFEADATKIFTEDELGEVCHHIGMFRQLGTVIKGAGGLRKFRWGIGSKGKRGGARLVYYYGGDHMPIFLIAIYAKSEKADMSEAERKAATKLVSTLQKEYEPNRQKTPQLKLVKDSRQKRR